MRPAEPLRKHVLRSVLVGLALAGTALPAAATTLIRAGLEELTDENSAVVVGRVLDAHSRWNDEGTFILTDVRVEVQETLKGDAGDGVLTVTLMGGAVDDKTVLIVGGARLVPGKSYVLFLNQEDLPGALAVRTVRDHCQGVFDVVDTKLGRRAVSQANAMGLIADAQGVAEPPGGAQGLAFESLVQQVRARAGAGGR